MYAVYKHAMRTICDLHMCDTHFYDICMHAIREKNTDFDKLCMFCQTVTCRLSRKVFIQSRLLPMTLRDYITHIALTYIIKFIMTYYQLVHHLYICR